MNWLATLLVMPALPACAQGPRSPIRRRICTTGADDARCRCPSPAYRGGCKSCQHQVEPDPAEMAARSGADTSVLEWRERLVCSRCGRRQADMVVTGTKRR
jgi:hypothetical protein